MSYSSHLSVVFIISDIEVLVKKGRLFKLSKSILWYTRLRTLSVCFALVHFVTICYKLFRFVSFATKNSAFVIFVEIGFKKVCFRYSLYYTDTLLSFCWFLLFIESKYIIEFKNIIK